ncbi:MmgE/PrpD family protein [Chloroflexota bacterium]
MDAASVFAEWVEKTRYEDIPTEVYEVTKTTILDTLGCMVAATTLGPTSKQIAKLVKSQGGKKESTILGFGIKAPSLMAAFANGCLARNLDYCESYYPAGHMSELTVSAGLSVAESIGRVSGRKFLTAIALGEEIACRLSSARRGGRHIFLGGWGATATVSKLLGLNKKGIEDAFGLLLQQCAGTGQIYMGLGTDVRSIRAGFEAKASVLSALLAKEGIVGPSESLEGQDGYFEVFFDGKYDRENLLGDLGKSFHSQWMSYKPWPCCRSTQGYLEATLKLVNENAIRTDQIQEIVPVVTELRMGNINPSIEERRRPATVMDAKFSLPFVLATAAAKRKVGLTDFMPASLRDSVVLELAQKVVPRMEPVTHDKDIGFGTVEIKMKDGRVLTKAVVYAYGHPRNPMSREEMVSKFRDCVSYSVKPLEKAEVDKVIDLIFHLEQVENLNEVVQLLG